MTDVETLPRSKSAPARTSSIHPRLSLGNQDSNTLTNAQSLNGFQPPTRTTDDIHTFVVWSVFNLLFLPFGILCCFFSHKVSQFKMQNRYEAARKWSKRTFVANIMTTLLMIGVIITVVMLHYDYEQRNPDTSANQTRTTGPYIPWQPGR